jgi:hypothetical protein
MNHKTKFWIFVSLILLIILLVFGIFYFSSKPNLEQAEEQIQEDELTVLNREINELINAELGIGVDVRELNLVDNYVPTEGYFDEYDVKVGDIYTSGEILVYYVIDKIKPYSLDGRLYVNYDNKVELVGPNGPVSDFNSLYTFEVKREVEEDKFYKNPMLLKYNVEDLDPGVYFLTVSAGSKKLEQRVSKELSFVVR